MIGEFAEIDEGDKFVEDEAGAEELTDVGGVLPTDAEEEGDGGEDPAEKLLHGGGEPGEEAMQPAEAAIDEGDERDEGDEHGADVEGELEAVAGAAGGGIDDVDAGFFDFDFDATEGFGFFRFGDEHFGEHDGGGGGHDDGGEEVADFDFGEEDVGGHDGTGDVGHAGGHDGEEFALGEADEEGTDGEGSFRLAHEDAGGDAGGFSTAGAHDAAHDEGHAFNDELHDAEVIQNAEEGRDKDDDGEDLEGEENAERSGGFTEGAKEEAGAFFGVAEEGFDGAAGVFKSSAEGRFENEEGEEQLEAEAPREELGADRSTVGREEPELEMRKASSTRSAASSTLASSR